MKEESTTASEVDVSADVPVKQEIVANFNQPP